MKDNKWQAKIIVDEKTKDSDYYTLKIKVGCACMISEQANPWSGSESSKTS